MGSINPSECCRYCCKAVWELQGKRSNWMWTIVTQITEACEIQRLSSFHERATRILINDLCPVFTGNLEIKMKIMNWGKKIGWIKFCRNSNQVIQISRRLELSVWKKAAVAVTAVKVFGFSNQCHQFTVIGKAHWRCCRQCPAPFRTRRCYINNGNEGSSWMDGARQV